ncbi:MAG: hypothetical protein OXT70_03900 [Chloroflexota bacterium]|nr:hypothetical protein [bacterium]MDE2987181.1 hypothetical protein [Chloroflexota bacterium]
MSQQRPHKQEFTLTPAEADAIRAGADEAGVTPTAFVRWAALSFAEALAHGGDITAEPITPEAPPHAAFAMLNAGFRARLKRVAERARQGDADAQRTVEFWRVFPTADRRILEYFGRLADCLNAPEAE